MENNIFNSDFKFFRKKAVELQKQKQQKSISGISKEEIADFIYELEVHQIELELQNDELRHAWAVAEVAVDKYTQLYDFAPTGYFTISREGNIIALNHCGSQMLGKERAQLITSRFDFWVHQDSRSGFNQFLERVFSGNVKETCQVTLEHPGALPAIVYLTGILAENRETCHVNMFDISERIRIEIRLRESEAKYRRLFELATFGVFQSTPEGKAISVNPAFVSMFGMTPSKTRC